MSGRHGRANPRPEKYVTRPRVSSSASPTTSGSGRRPHPVGSVRTWPHQRCFFVRCRSHQPPRVGESRESSRISWKALRSDGPRALPPEGRDTPQNLMPRLLDSCGKPRSTSGARATPRLWPRATSATSTIIATVGPASTRGCAEATTPGVGDATTAGRIGALARTTRSTGLQPGHPAGTVPDPVPTPDYYHKVLGGDETGIVARGLPPGLLAGWNGRRQPHHPQPPPVPLRHRSRLVGAPASRADLQLG
jgi:hypothetical protein